MDIILAIAVYAAIAFGLAVLVGRGSRDPEVMDRLMEHFSQTD